MNDKPDFSTSEPKKTTSPVSYPGHKTIVDLLAEQVHKTPDNVAVVFDQQQLTYRELDEQSSQFANYLRRCGVNQETLVPICLNRSLAMIVGLLGILKAGGAYVPIDPDYPLDRIKYILSDVNGPVVVVDAQSRPAVSAVNIGATIVCIDSDGPTISLESTDYPQTVLTPQNVAYVIYTSGSTGRPKGVMIEHENVVRLFFTDAPLFDFDARDVWTMFHSFCFDFSVWEMYGALLYGGRLVIVLKDVAKDATLFRELLVAQQVTVLNQTPSAFYVLQDQVVGHVESLAIRYVILGGEALNPGKLNAWKQAYPDCQLINMYGITETTVHVTYQALDEQHLTQSSLIGKPIPTLTTYVLDPEQREVAVGETGELYVGGAGLARGYLNQPTLTASRFIPHPFSNKPGERLYRSGDLARLLSDGNLEYIGRIDEQVKIRGYRIELGEIEGVLQQYPGVKHAVVLAKEDTEGDKRLVGYVVMDALFDRTDITAFLHTKLPDYMVPVLVVPIETIPLTSNGKVDRNALPNPDASDLLTNAYVAPGTNTEEKLTAVWKQVLHVNRVGRSDNFFELGGNSLLAVKTVSILKQAYQYDIPVTKLYQFPTVNGLAGFVEGRTKATSLHRKPSRKTDTSGDVAVIGMAGRFPGANTIDELWTILKEGKETIHFFQANELDATLPAALTNDSAYVKARGIIDRADQFDAGFFGLNAKLAEVMDPQQRIFMEIVWEVLEKTGHLPQQYGGSIGVWAGCGNNTYYLNNVLRNQPVVSQIGSFQAMTVNEKDFIASRTAYQLNLTGPAVSTYSACSSSLLAITQAVESLRIGKCEVAIAGGASITAPIYSGHLYEEGAMLSRDGHCRPFDAQAQGTVFSDGAGVVLLKSLEAAQQDSDTIYAVIKGVGVNNDGGGKGSFTAPNAEGQAGAIRMALEDAQVDPATISYVEAHGTATPLGDPIEIEGLKMAFGADAQKQVCALGSIKSNMGHLTAAAGVAGFIKTTLALYHKQLPASLGFDTPNPVIDFADSPFYVNNRLTEWELDTVRRANPSERRPRRTNPRRAGVSSFGVGGTNVHVVVEEYVPVIPANVAEPVLSRPVQLITWSAKSTQSVATYATQLARSLQEQEGVNLADVAFTLQTTRATFSHRRFVVAATADQLIDKLLINPVASSTPHDGTNLLLESPGETVFLFPGQGSQYVGMGRGLYEHETVYRQAVDDCATLLGSHLDTDIRDVLYPDTIDLAAKDRLKNTRYTQPALFVTEYALAKLWTSWGIEPTIFCGHSIGEFVAAHLAGVFTLSDALTLVAARGRLISGLPRGSMLSVRLEAEKVYDLLPRKVSMAAINSHKQCVVAGPDEDIAAFAQLLDSQEIPNRVLATSHAFHSAMLDPILAEFKTLVQSVSLHRPQKPIVSTVSGTWLTDGQATDPTYWATHMRLPVQFAQALDTLFTLPRPVFLEAGPGTVTTTLARQHRLSQPVETVLSLDTNAGVQSESESMVRALGEVWLQGLEPDWKAFYAGQTRNKVVIPTYAFDRKRCWVDPLGELPKTEAIQIIHKDTTGRVVETYANMTMRKNNILETVKTLLNETAGIDAGDVSIISSFIELGLDSLALTQLSFNFRKKFGLPISFRQLSSEYSTLESLVNYLDSKLPADVYQPPAPVVQPLLSVATPVPTPQPMAILPVATSEAEAMAGDSGPVMNLFARQLEIMAQQLAVLRGQAPLVPSAPPIQPVADSALPTKAAERAPEKDAEIRKPFGAGARIERQITALDSTQKRFLHELIERYNKKTAGSKAYAQEHRRWMADPRAVTGFKPLTKELVYPLVVDQSKGSRLWDIDGNEYIDVLNGFGSNMFGYQPDVLKKVLYEQIEKGYEIGPQHKLAGEVSQLICEFTDFDRAALCNTGSEAVLATLRIARTVTGRSLVVIFSGSYHGTFDEVIARGSSSLKSYPAALGIMPESVQNVLILDYGTDESLQIIRERAHELAAVLVEPVQSRRPEFQPVDFLRQVRTITEASGTVLIFDEVITGFRMHPGGAQALFSIKADLATYGKVVGGGLPIGIVAGKAKFMDSLDGGFWAYGDASYPEADITFFAGTFVRHPLALAAAKASLLYMKESGPDLQKSLTAKAKQLADTLNAAAERQNLPLFVAQFGSLWKIKFTEEIPYGELVFILLREKGVHIWDGFPCFMTEAHTDEEINRIGNLFLESINELTEAGFLTGTHAPQGKSNNPAVFVDVNQPPMPGAKLGRDKAGNPAWFTVDPTRPGKYLQLDFK